MSLYKWQKTKNVNSTTNYDNALTGTGTYMTMGKYFMMTNLWGEALMKYKLPVIKNGKTMNSHLLKIQAELTKYLFPVKVLTKNKRSMRQCLGQTHQ